MNDNLIKSLKSALDKGKEIEQNVLEFDPVYDNMLKANELVKEFIITNGLIIYGGTAIDMALRLLGDKIYPDNMFPDLDFYSPNNTTHAYQLADILYHNGFKECRVINALHMKTMKVDIIDNHFIADISYQPEEIFNLIPTLTYNGMKIVHPLFQSIDTHSALCFPYDGAPKEVIFARWKKDISRFQLLSKYYPIVTENVVTIGKKISIPITMRKQVLSGIIAYAFMCKKFTEKLQSKPAINIQLLITDSIITFDTIQLPESDYIDIVHFDIEKAAAQLSLNDIKIYEPVGSILPMKLIGRMSNHDVRILSTKNKLLSIDTFHTDHGSFRIVNSQFLLKYFLAMYFAHNSPGYLALYDSLLSMVLTEDSPLGLSIDTYGNDNVDISKQVLLNKLYSDLYDDVPFIIPSNYYPNRNIPIMRPHPPFNPDDSEFFRENGKLMTLKHNQ